MPNSNDVANEAIQSLGNNQPLVTGVNPTWDDSPNGIALRYLYTPTVAFVARQFEYDFSRNTLNLSLSGNLAPRGWALEYIYPVGDLEIWQLLNPAIDDSANNPLPTTWQVANNIVAGAQAKVIHTNFANAMAVVNNNPNENTWDYTFRAAVVQLLGARLAIATAGKPDIYAALFQAAGTFSAVARSRSG